MKNRILIMAGLWLFVGCNSKETEIVESRVEALPYYGEASFTPKWFSADSDSLKIFIRFHPLN